MRFSIIIIIIIVVIIVELGTAMIIAVRRGIIMTCFERLVQSSLTRIKNNRMKSLKGVFEILQHASVNAAVWHKLLIKIYRSQPSSCAQASTTHPSSLELFSSSISLRTSLKFFVTDGRWMFLNPWLLHSSINLCNVCIFASISSSFSSFINGVELYWVCNFIILRKTRQSRRDWLLDLSMRNYPNLGFWAAAQE